MGIKIPATTKVIRKGPGGETTVTTPETSPTGGMTTVTTTGNSPVTIPCPKCGGKIMVQTASCSHCGANWRGKKPFTFQTQQKIDFSGDSIKKILVILLQVALGAAVLIFLIT